MRIFATFSMLLLFALAVFLMAPRKALPPHAALILAPTNAPHSARSTPTPDPTNGFYVGKGDDRVFIDFASPNPVLRSFLQSVMDGATDPKAQGREIFTRICAACHQRDGDGKDGVAPPLLGSEWVMSPNGSRLMHIVLSGVNGPIRVRGRDWNLSMPPWRETLNDDQISVVLTYIRAQLGTNHASAITPEAVAAVRKDSSATPETATTLLRISDQ